MLAAHRTTRLALTLATGLLLSLSVARADEPTASDKAMAEALFRAGRELVDAGKIAEGCPKLEESFRLENKVGTLLNVALCHEQLGKTASAWAELIEVAAQAGRLKQNDRVQFAQERAKALEKKLSRVKLTAPHAEPGLTVSLDGKTIGASAFGVAMPLDPGDHKLLATAPGKAPFALTVTVTAGPSEKTVEIPALSPEGAAPPTGTLAPTSSAPISTASSAPSGPTSSAPTATATLSPTSTPEPSGPNGMFIGGLAAAGVGVAGLVAGGVFGGLTLSKEAEADKTCPDKVCPDQKSLDLHAEARTFSTISTIGFGVGIAGAGVGLTLLLLSRSSGNTAPKTGMRPVVAPVLGPSAAGLTAVGRF